MSVDHDDGPETLATLAVLSLFRSGWDTAAARYAKSVVTELPRREWINVVAGQMWPDWGERRRQIEDAFSRVDVVLRLGREAGHRPLTLFDPDYPELLKHIVDPPLILWTQGNCSLLSRPGVSVVGSRNAQATSLAIARSMARDLAASGLVVISGMARGVDSAAHTGALDAGGSTIAVVGSGLLRVFPKSNEKLAAAIRETGAIVSELPADALPYPQHFPLRNRIISGLAKATVIVEAGLKSGSLITAKQANEQGRSVLAVPGGTLSGAHRGSHHLIKDGARLVDTVEDVWEEIGWTHRPALESSTRNHLQLSDLESNMARGESYSVDNLAEKTRRTTSDLLAELSMLELHGRVVRTPGGMFIRTTGTTRTNGNDGN